MSSKIYFSVLDGNTFDQSQREMLAAAVLEHQRFLIIASSAVLLADASNYVNQSVGVRPVSVLIPSGVLLATAENFLASTFPEIDAEIEKCFYRLCLKDGDIEKISQLKVDSFGLNSENHISCSTQVEYLHPIVKSKVQSVCAEYNEFNSLVIRLLNGYSFLSDSMLRSRCGDSDLDGLQLRELKAFNDYLSSVVGGFSVIQPDVQRVISYFNSLINVCPTNSTELSTTATGAAMQNGFPCVYKVMSVFHFLGYELSLQRKLYNKAFMHLFRSYECYSCGAMFLYGAEISDELKKGVLEKDIYKLGTARVFGFGTVFKAVGKEFNVLGDSDYQMCDFYLKLRNKFHYPHGDVKVSEGLLHEFSRSVIRQLLNLERRGNQKHFLWKRIYRDIKGTILADNKALAYDAILRELNINGLYQYTAV